MPSTIGHALAGYAVARVAGGAGCRRTWPAVVLANVADVDIVAGLAQDRPNAYHGRATHSLGAALGAGLLMGLCGRLRGERFGPCFAEGAAAYGSHLALDYLGKESEDGLPLLWPLSDRRFGVRRPLFHTIRSRRGHFITGLFTRRGNVRAVARELAVLLPVVLLARRLGRR